MAACDWRFKFCQWSAYGRYVDVIAPVSTLLVFPIIPWYKYFDVLISQGEDIETRGLSGQRVKSSGSKTCMIIIVSTHSCTHSLARTYTGTSMAAAYVCGVMANYLSELPDETTPADLKKKIIKAWVGTW